MTGKTPNYQIFALVHLTLWSAFLAFEVPDPYLLHLSSGWRMYIILPDCLWNFYTCVDSLYIQIKFNLVLLIFHVSLTLRPARRTLKGTGHSWSPTVFQLQYECTRQSLWYFIINLGSSLIIEKNKSTSKLISISVCLVKKCSLGFAY